MSSLVIFDVCNTLFKHNTTFGFINYALRHRPIKRLALASISSRFSPLFFVLAIIYRLTGKDFSRLLALQLLRGERAETLQKYARCYVKRILPATEISEMHSKLHQHVENNHDVILVSASIDIVVAEIGKTLGITWHASRLEFSNDAICRGRIIDDLTYRKLEVVETMLVQSPAVKLIVYTDNISDMPLVRRADSATVVVYSSKQRDLWAGIEATILELP